MNILRFCALLLTLCLCACAKPAPAPILPVPMPDAPQAVAVEQSPWQRYLEYCAVTTAQGKRPYRLQMSLRYGDEGDTRRVTALLWGNTAEHLRLDVSAGVGAMVANILEDGRSFTVYAPREKRAYTHKGARPLLTLGVPVPFGVGDLAALLGGRFDTVFGEAFTGTAKPAKGNTFLYTVAPGRAAGTLNLNTQGLPVLWVSDAKEGWRMEISYGDSTPPLPHKIELQHTKGQRAIVLVKEREYPAKPFTDAQMRLTLPTGTPLLPLQQFKQSAAR